MQTQASLKYTQPVGNAKLRLGFIGYNDPYGEAWYRAIYLGEEPVGFVMLEDDSLLDPMPEKPEVGVWRFMVDAKHQRTTYGTNAFQPFQYDRVGVNVSVPVGSRWSVIASGGKESDVAKFTNSADCKDLLKFINN